MIKFEVKYDRGNKNTKSDTDCEACKKPIKNTDNAWEVNKIASRGHLLGQFYGCCKECANLIILKEL